MRLLTSSRTALALLLLTSTATLLAQKNAQQPTRLDLAITYTAQRSIKANTTQNFWSQGGSIELGSNLWHGLGAVADVTGTHTGSIGSSGVPLSLVTVTFGPRYRWHDGHTLSLYAQALAGEANGFHSIFPGATATQSDANSLALQIGGGIDYKLGHHLAARLLDAAWLRTQLPNSTNNTQNNLRLGAGVVLRFGH